MVDRDAVVMVDRDVASLSIRHQHLIDPNTGSTDHPSYVTLREADGYQYIAIRLLLAVFMRKGKKLTCYSTVNVKRGEGLNLGISQPYPAR